MEQERTKQAKYKYQKKGKLISITKGQNYVQYVKTKSAIESYSGGTVRDCPPKKKKKNPHHQSFVQILNVTYTYVFGRKKCGVCGDIAHE